MSALMKIPVEKHISINKLIKELNFSKKHNIYLHLNNDFIDKFKDIDELYKTIFCMDEDFHLFNTLRYYHDNEDLQLIHFKKKVEHDGYDRYGPQSNIYTLRVYYRKNNDYNIYIDTYMREYWFDGEDDDHYIKY